MKKRMYFSTREEANKHRKNGERLGFDIKQGMYFLEFQELKEM